MHIVIFRASLAIRSLQLSCLYVVIWSAYMTLSDSASIQWRQLKRTPPPLEYDFVLFSKQVVGNNIPEHNDEPMKYWNTGCC